MTFSARCRSARLLAALVGTSLLAAGCGGEQADGDRPGPATSRPAVDCPGAPVRLMTITNVTGPNLQSPEVPAAARAAASAVNATCELGRPIEIVACDDKFDSNGAAACGRRAVDEKVTAVVGNFSGFGDNFMPLLDAAGIPAFGGVATGIQENQSAKSFPFIYPIQGVFGMVSTLSAAGAKNIRLVTVDLPTVSFFVNLAKDQVAQLGASYNGLTTVAPDATDLTTAAAQATSSGADGLALILGGSQVEQFVTALDQQGTDRDTVKIVLGANSATPAFISQLGDKVEGALIAGWAWPSTDDGNDGIRQMRTELGQAGEPAETSDVGVATWAAVHETARLLEGATVFDAATMLARLQTLGRIDHPELTPIDFSKPAFPEDPLLSTFRLFSNQQIVTKVVDGRVTLATDGYVGSRSSFSLGR